MTTTIKITEKALQLRVTNAAQALGWEYHHETNSFGTRPGWPDLALFHPDHGALYLELKVGTRKVTDAQASWLRTLHRAGQRVAVIRETDHDHHVLMEFLTGDYRHLDLVDGVYGLDGAA